MLYLTPALYRTMGFGTDLSDVEDGELLRQLNLASTLVNRACNRPGAFDFRGGTITGEQHRWDVGNTHAPIVPLIAPVYKPLKTITAYSIRVTSGQSVTVNPDYVVYDPSTNQLQVVAFGVPSIWTTSVIPSVGLSQPLASISYTYGWEFSVTGEELVPEGGSVYRAANQWWTTDDVEVYQNGLALGPGDYTVDRNEGTVTLASPPDYDDVITADYIHRLPPEIRDAVGVVATDLLGARNIVGAGLLGLSGIKAEEIELRQSTDRSFMAGPVSDRVFSLVAPYRDISWG